MSNITTKMRLQYLAFFCIFCISFVAARKSYQGYKVYQVINKNEGDFNFMTTLQHDGNFDFWSPNNRIGQPINIMVTPEKQEYFQETLKTKDIDFQIVNQDVEASHQLERNDLLSRSKSKGASPLWDFMTTWSHEEINYYLSSIAERYPDLASEEIIGKSFENRDIKVLRISTDITAHKPQIFVEAGINGRDWITTSAAIFAIQDAIENSVYYVNHEFVILPTANPDGYEYSRSEDRLWKKTMSEGTFCHGVDAYRNFGYMWNDTGSDGFECSDNYSGPEEFSEIETRIIRDYVKNSPRMAGYVSVRSCGLYCLYPFSNWENPAPGNDDDNIYVASMASSLLSWHGETYAVGNSARILGPAAGASIDWFAFNRLPAVSILVPCGTLDSGFGYSMADKVPLFQVVAEGLRGASSGLIYLTPKN